MSDALDLGDNVVSHGKVDAAASGEALARFFRSSEASGGGNLIIGFPLSPNNDLVAPDGVYISPDKGVIVFHLVDGTTIDPAEVENRQNDGYQVIFNKLSQQKTLMEGKGPKKTIAVAINTVTYAPGASTDDQTSSDYPIVTSDDDLAHFLATVSFSEGKKYFEATLSAIQSMGTIRKNRKRRTLKGEGPTKGSVLTTLEESIATLDGMQSHAVIETSDDVQRIRGLAGSGKTVVLARKAAYLHLKNPDYRIAVTFNTRSLKMTLRDLILQFSSLDNVEPDWNNLRVLNAWGASGGEQKEGIYHQFCVNYGLKYLDYMSAKRKFGYAAAFDGACQDALEQLSNKKPTKPLYDLILIDEAQDLPPSFLQICYMMLGKKKRLVYAYDELQTLNGDGLPAAEEIFGRNSAGIPNVSFEGSEKHNSSDIMLEKCYRNSAPVLATAHAIGFGIYRQPHGDNSTGIVQMFERPELWKDIGYKLKSGSLDEGSHVELARTNETSPEFLERAGDVDEIINFKKFETKSEQDRWVADQIQKNLDQDELNHSDIIVIDPTPINATKNVGDIRVLLRELNINSHVAGVDTSTDVFFSDEDSVAFSGIYRAKGNEAAVVYVVNSQENITSVANLATIRNRLFTAITRSKGWVRVLGWGDDMQVLMDEFAEIQRNHYSLKFQYPTSEERKKMRIVHRDVDSATQKKIDTADHMTVAELYQAVEEGNLVAEDLDPALLDKLQTVLGY